MTKTSSELEKVSKLPEYSVHRLFTDGRGETVGWDLPAEQAAQEFYRCANNVSAMTGTVVRVFLIDGLDHIKVTWAFGKGYSYDGEHYSKTPWLTDERH
jgi:hypothetical protein